MTATDKKSSFLSFFHSKNKKVEKSDGRSKSGLKAWKSHESLLSSTTLTLPSSKTKTAANSDLYRSTLQREYLSQLGAEYSGSSLSLNIEVDQSAKNRVDNSLTISVAEAKNVVSKKKCFCEVYINDNATCKTTAKQNDSVLFWGEHFELKALPTVQAVTIKLYEQPDSKKKKDTRQLLGSVEIPSSDILCSQPVEKWYSLNSPTTIRRSPTSDTVRLRVKARYQSVPILPTEMYDELVEFLKTQYKQLVEQLEPVVSTKVKEGIGDSLVRVMIGLGLDLEFLTDVTMAEVSKIESTQLLFRSNSVATKSVEAYLKLYAGKYIKQTLEDVIHSLIDNTSDYEVDPLRLTGKTSLTDNQERLHEACQMAWYKIFNSARTFPTKLKMLFSRLRHSCRQMERGDVSDHLISACLFLRLICPAILAPNLFHITQDFPSVKVARTLTLVAKTIQTLANFSEFGSKEEYMAFMNNFIERESPFMKTYLQRISEDDSQSNQDDSSRDDTPVIDIDLELSVLHAKLSDALSKVDEKSAHAPSSNVLETVNHILANIDAYAKNPDLFHRKRSLLSPIAPSPPPLVVSQSSPALQHHLPLWPKIDVVEVVRTDSPASDANLIQLDCVSPASISALQRLSQENHKSADVNLLANEPAVPTDIGLAPQTKCVKAIAAREETHTLESEQHNDVITSDNNDIQATVEDSWRQIVSAADSTSADHVTLVSFSENYNHPSFPPSWTAVDFAARDLPSIASETSANVSEMSSITTPPSTRVITITRNGTSDFSNASESQRLSTIVTESKHSSSSSRSGVNTGLRRRSGTLPNNFIVETFEESLSSSIKTDNFASPHTASATSVTPKASPIPPVRTHRPGHLHQQHQQQVVERADVIPTQQPTVTVSVSMQLHDELALKSAALRVTERRDRWPGAMLASSSAITEPEFV